MQNYSEASFFMSRGNREKQRSLSYNATESYTRVVTLRFSFNFLTICFSYNCNIFLKKYIVKLCYKKHFVYNIKST